MRVSLALTVLNEGEHICRLFDSIIEQTRLPDEVVVCDGGSRDNTLRIVRQYSDRLPLRAVQAPGANISTGRNVAICAATSEIIAVTDAGVRLSRNWLEQLVKPFSEASVALVAGFYEADAQTVFEMATGATVLPFVAEIDPARFLPSSRSVAFRKSAWEAVGGYPEWLDFSEDVVFDLRVREKFGSFAFAPEALVHFRPRASLGEFSRQYFNYALGDGRAGLFRHIHILRYFTYLVVVPLGVYAAVTVSPWLWLLGTFAGVAYIRVPLRRLLGLWDDLSLTERRRVLFLVPLVRVVGDLAKMVGYPVGVWKKFWAR